MVHTHKSGYKDFLAVFLLLKEYSLTTITQAIEELGVEKVNAETLRQHLQVGQNNKTHTHPAQDPTAIASVTIADTYRFDQLLAKEAG